MELFIIDNTVSITPFMAFRSGLIKPFISSVNAIIIFATVSIYSLLEYGNRYFITKPLFDKAVDDLVVKLNSIVGVDASVIRDKIISDREYLMINGNITDVQLLAIQTITTSYQTNKLVVEVGNDSHFHLELPESIGTVLVIMKNIASKAVRQILMQDFKDYEYLMQVITAEYHTTAQFCRTIAQENCESYGVNQYPGGSFIGLTKPRNETYYPIKYANLQSSQYVSRLVQPGQSYGVFYDKGINVITFRLTKEQFSQAKSYINGHIKAAGQVFNTHKESLHKLINDSSVFPNAMTVLIKLAYLYWHANDHVYSFIGLGGDNCNTVTQRIYEASGLPGHYFDTMKFDELYLRDKGIVFNIFYNQIANLKYLSPIDFFGNLLTIRYYYNFADPEILSPVLHALRAEDYHQAIKLLNTLSVGDLNNITDVKGYGVLHYIAGINKDNAQKATLLDLALSQGALVTRADALQYKTSASICVEQDDIICLQALYHANASAITFVNHNQDNLIHIALLVNPKAYAAAKFLYEQEELLAYQDNLEHNLPICTLIKEGMVSVENFDDRICKSEDQVLCRYVEPVFGETL